MLSAVAKFWMIGLLTGWMLVVDSLWLSAQRGDGLCFVNFVCAQSLQNALASHRKTSKLVSTPNCEKKERDQCHVDVEKHRPRKLTT